MDLHFNALSWSLRRGLLPLRLRKRPHGLEKQKAQGKNRTGFFPAFQIGQALSLKKLFLRIANIFFLLIPSPSKD